ncbi:MAG TPA: 2-dehydropantoate 2-reductase [Verrucomicrobiae bacterium]|jgi:2-dehydropantoate 2-reductase|nr:2-dehydropantoate 2-reductase [Verrucomicrobiae bacterium]
MKIAIVGCGALGSYYGSLLCRAGHETHFLLRSDYETVRRDGVTILSGDGDFNVHPHCARRPEEIGPADLVIIGLKTTANATLPQILPALIGPKTLVLTLQNGLGNESFIAGIVGGERTLGGLCFVCLNRIAPGKIHHIAHGVVILGEYGRPAEDRTRMIAQAIADTGIRCHATDNIEQAHWEKLVWNIPFNGLGVAGAAGYEAVVSGHLAPSQPVGPCLTTDILLGEVRWAQLVRELMLETIHAANALGYPIPESAADHQITRTRTMGAYKASTLIDFERRQPLELESLFLEPWRQAQKAGIPCPRLAALCSLLQQLAP